MIQNPTIRIVCLFTALCLFIFSLVYAAQFAESCIEIAHRYTKRVACGADKNIHISFGLLNVWLAVGIFALLGAKIDLTKPLKFPRRRK